MPERVQASSIVTLVTPTHVAEHSAVQHSANGIGFASFGEIELKVSDLERMVQAVPGAIAAALTSKLYYFVPLAIGELHEDPTSNAPTASAPDTRPAAIDETLISPIYTVELGDQATCHRNVTLPARATSTGADAESASSCEGVFISTRLLGDRFALAFEFFINVGHAYVDARGVPVEFAELAWAQALADVRGETSQDAWESRNLAIKGEPTRILAPDYISRSDLRRISTRSVDRPPLEAGSSHAVMENAAIENAASEKAASEKAASDKAKANFLESAFSDAIAIYLLSLSVDFDYSELREREYPLLAPLALAERLRLVARLFPPNHTYEFAIRYRKRA